MSSGNNIILYTYFMISDNDKDFVEEGRFSVLKNSVEDSENFW